MGGDGWVVSSVPPVLLSSVGSVGSVVGSAVGSVVGSNVGSVAGSVNDVLIDGSAESSVASPIWAVSPCVCYVPLGSVTWVSGVLSSTGNRFAQKAASGSNASASSNTMYFFITNSFLRICIYRYHFNTILQNLQRTSKKIPHFLKKPGQF